MTTRPDQDAERQRADRLALSPAELICPLCGQPNACGMTKADGSPADEPCWCVGLSFDEALLAAVPEPLRRVACICQRCANQGQAAPRAEEAAPIAASVEPAPAAPPEAPEAPELVLPDELAPLLAQLQLLEPLIYAANGGATREHFEQLLAPDFWEVGASGKPYSRAFVLSVLEQRQRYPIQEPWSATEHHLQRLAPGLFLLSYTLNQATRQSRRMSLWRQTGTGGAQGWQLQYHQGTTVQQPEPGA